MNTDKKGSDDIVAALTLLKASVENDIVFWISVNELARKHGYHLYHVGHLPLSTTNEVDNNYYLNK